MPKIYKGHKDASPSCHSVRLQAINKMKLALITKLRTQRMQYTTSISNLLPAEIHEDENLYTEADPHDF